MAATARPPREALAQLRDVASDRLAAARAHKAAGGQVIAFLCDNVPLELIVATGAFPLRIHARAGSNLEATRRYVDTLYSPELTQRPDFAGSLLGRILVGDYNFVDAVIVPHNRNAIQAIHRELGDAAREHGLTLPATWYLDKAWSPDDDAAAYNYQAVSQLRDRLARHIGREITDDALRAAIAEVDRARACLARLSTLRRDGLVPGSVALELAGAFWSLPPSTFADLADAALSCFDMGTGAVRLYLSGSPIEDACFYQHVEQAGGVIVDEDHCWGSRAADHRIDPDLPPLQAIAARFHAHPACSIRLPFQRTIDANLARATRSGARAAIMHVAPGDRVQALEAPEQLRALEGAGLPVLSLEQLDDSAGEVAALIAGISRD
jgi:hypothetical protein